MAREFIFFPFNFQVKQDQGSKSSSNPYKAKVLKSCMPQVLELYFQIYQSLNGDKQTKITKH